MENINNSPATPPMASRTILKISTLNYLLKQGSRPVPFQNVNGPIKHQPPFFVKAAGDFFMSFLPVLQTFAV
jgi:hypothetical protein